MLRYFHLILVVLACAAVAAVAEPPNATAAPTRMEKRLIVRINHARAAHGLRRLRIGPRIQRGAHWWSSHLLRSDSFYHSRLRVGTSEILAWGTCSYFTPRRAVQMWLRSAGHRPLLLDPTARYVGTGWTRGGWCGYRCVEMAVARFR